jgi:hypothetical protein
MIIYWIRFLIIMVLSSFGHEIFKIQKLQKFKIANFPHWDVIPMETYL